MTETLSTPDVKPLGLLARMVGIITAPKATFENVVKAPRPAGVLFVVAAIIAIGTVAPQFTEKGRQAVYDVQVKTAEGVAARLGQPMTQEAYAALDARSRSVAWRMVGLVNPFLGLPIWCLLVAAVYWAAFNIVLGGTATFKQALAIVTHSQVIGALGMVAGVPIVLLSGKMNPFGPFNLGALAPTLEAGSRLATFLGSVSIFGLWSMLVAGTGLGVLYRRSGLTIGIVLVVIYLLFMYGLSSLFGSFMGGA
jgi:hypothetical protein